jgi:hypothetical protein
MATPKFRVGERVRVRKNLVRICYMHEDSIYVSNMKNYEGDVVTISACTSGSRYGEFVYRVKDNPFAWDEYLLEPLNESLDEPQDECCMYGDACCATYTCNKPISWSLSSRGIKKVIYNNPATIILWEDGTKTVVKVQNGDTYSKELGFAMCVSKKYFGNQSNFNNVFKKYVYDKE